MPKTRIEIIYSDADILVVNKPSGVSVTKDRSGAAELSDILAGQSGKESVSNLRLIHRLDKDTSGVMILAKTKEAQSLYSSLFAKRQVNKTYLAIVTGVLPGREGKIESHLTRSSSNPRQMCIIRKRGKEAVTGWRLLADFGSIALLSVSPLTGRTHQIRVHLPSIGLPLAIDPLYGSNRPLCLSDFKSGYRLAKDKIEKPLIDRLTLHAYQLSIENCKSKIENCFVAGLDKKFKATIKMLTKHNPKGLEAFCEPDDFSKIINNKKL